MSDLLERHIACETWPRFAAAWPRPPLGPVAKRKTCGWWPSRNTLGWMRFGPWSPPAARIWAKAGRNSFGIGPPNLRDLPVRWHMIGHMQRNKVERTLPLVAMIHSLDSLRLAEAIDAAAGKLDRISAGLVGSEYLPRAGQARLCSRGDRTASAEADRAEASRDSRPDVHGRPGGRRRGGPSRFCRPADPSRPIAGNLSRKRFVWTSFRWA